MIHSGRATWVGRDHPTTWWPALLTPTLPTYVGPRSEKRPRRGRCPHRSEVVLIPTSDPDSEGRVGAHNLSSSTTHFHPISLDLDLFGVGTLTRQFG